MNTILLRAGSAGLLFLLIFLFGFWLSRSGKPYPVIVFTVHKLFPFLTLISSGGALSLLLVTGRYLG